MHENINKNKISHYLKFQAYISVKLGKIITNFKTTRIRLNLVNEEKI